MVTFETKVWDKDWEYILKGNYLEKMISVNNFTFRKRHIIINNVKNRGLVEKYCEKKRKEGIIDDYYYVGDYESEVLNYFDLTVESFKGGYHYSIAELVGIYICDTKYLLHYSGDSFLTNNSQNWIWEGLEIMEQLPNVLVANPTWNNKFEEVKSGSLRKLKNFHLGRGFSDQCYLIRSADFRKRIYHDKNALSERFPKYGGELFEKRVDAYMRNNNLYRINHAHISYISSNFPQDWISRKIIRKKIIQARISQMVEMV